MKKRLLPWLIIASVIGAVGGYWLAQKRMQKENFRMQQKPLYYRDPMNPSVTSPVPKKDEMGMDYVPVYAEKLKREESEPPGMVTIDPVTIQDIGVRTARVEQRTLSRPVRTVGRITYNEELIARLHPKTEGWITKLYVDETGEQVKHNQELLQIYSPQLVATEEEYVLALDNLDTLKKSPFKDVRQGAENLVKSTRERLVLLDVPAHQITVIEETRKIEKKLHIHSPFDGIVVNIGAREGTYVTPKTEIYMIASLARVWVYVDIYEYEIPWVKLGDEAEMTLAGLPGQQFKGRITYIYPYLENKTRTLTVRLNFENPKLALKPEMFASVTIHASRRINALVVPEQAVVDSGIRDRVFVVRAPGKFEPRSVKVGIRADGFAQILEGLKKGEEVVTSSQFLIDSESKLREAAALMTEPNKSSPADQHSHGAHP